jgi:hypothetical protein
MNPAMPPKSPKFGGGMGSPLGNSGSPLGIRGRGEWGGENRMRARGLGPMVLRQRAPRQSQ